MLFLTLTFVNKNDSTKEIAPIQDKALRISFKGDSAAAGPLYYEKKNIEFFDLISFSAPQIIAGQQSMTINK